MTPYYDANGVQIFHGDALQVLKILPEQSVNCCVTSPAYWGLRDYGTAKWEGGDLECDHKREGQGKPTWGPGSSGTSTLKGRPNNDNHEREAHYVDICGKCGASRIDSQLGLESTPEEYVSKLVEIFREVRRVLRDDGTVFLNLGDSYYGSWGNYGGQNRGKGMQRQINTGSQVPNPAYDGLTKFRPPTAGVARVVACGTSGTAPEGCQENDCLCESLCDVCRAAYQLGKAHSVHQHVPTLEPSPYVPNREHTESSPAHPPTLDSVHQAGHNLTSSKDLERAGFPEDAQPPVSQESTRSESDQPLSEMRSEASTQGEECRLCGHSLGYSAPLSERRKACTCGTSQSSFSSGSHNQGTDHSVYPYLNYTREYRLKPKDLCGIPWRVAFALQSDGWYLRSDIIYSKPNPMPESVTDRPTKAHEYIFLLSKSERYYYNGDAIKEPAVWGVPNSPESIKSPYGQGFTRRSNDFNRNGTRLSHGEGSDEKYVATEDSRRNKRSVWTIATQPYPEAHFATFPEKLVEPCILAGCLEGGTVLDPFIGSGTTAAVAKRLNCKAIGVELNESYIQLAMKRLAQSVLAF